MLHAGGLDSSADVALLSLGLVQCQVTSVLNVQLQTVKVASKERNAIL